MWFAGKEEMKCDAKNVWLKNKAQNQEFILTKQTEGFDLSIKKVQKIFSFQF